MPRTVKVAIVGSGLAGLTAAYLLSNMKTTTQGNGELVEFEVHLFEKSSAIGMDAYSISMPNVNPKEEWRVDVPMRSFQGGYYPELIRLYRKLGLDFSERNFTYSFACPSEPLGTHSVAPNLIYNGANGLRGASLPSSLKASATSLTAVLEIYTRFALSILAACVAYVWLLWLSAPSHRSTNISTLTLREWTMRTTPRGFLSRLVNAEERWRAFVSEIVVPLFSAVCTAPADDIWNHPVEEILDYIWRSILTPHYVVANGVREVTSVIASSISHIHLRSPIVRLSTDGAQVALELGNGEVHHGFTHVVFATQANSAARILGTCAGHGSALGEERQLQRVLQHLEVFRYVKNIVVNHSDESLLPPAQEDRRELNLVSRSTPSKPEKSDVLDVDGLQVSRGFTMATHVLQSPDGAETVFQTTNPTIAISPSTIKSVARMERAVLTPQSKAARGAFITPEGELGPLQGICAMKGGSQIWFCGSYVGNGIPLLEGCVVSARTVVEKGIFVKEGVRADAEPW